MFSFFKKQSEKIATLERAVDELTNHTSALTKQISDLRAAVVQPETVWVRGTYVQVATLVQLTLEYLELTIEQIPASREKLVLKGKDTRGAP